jgi:hypothetical protein
MKKTVVVLMLMFSAGTAFAAHDEWTADDTKRQAAYLLVYVADWNQTRYIATHKNIMEINPILGEHPSVSRVDGYFMAVAVIHTGIAYLLPAEWRKAFQYVTLGFEAGIVTGNYYRSGIQISF